MDISPYFLLPTPFPALSHNLDERNEAMINSAFFMVNPPTQTGIDCGALVCKFMLKACRKGRYKAAKSIAAVASNLRRASPKVPVRLIDTLLEEIHWFMENPNFRDHQRTLVCARLFGELYCAAAIPSSVIFEELLLVLSFGHNVPEALREASEHHVMFVPKKAIFLRRFSKMRRSMTTMKRKRTRGKQQKKDAMKMLAPVLIKSSRKSS